MISATVTAVVVPSAAVIIAMLVVTVLVVTVLVVTILVIIAMLSVAELAFIAIASEVFSTLVAPEAHVRTIVKAIAATVVAAALGAGAEAYQAKERHQNDSFHVCWF